VQLKQLHQQLFQDAKLKICKMGAIDSKVKNDKDNTAYLQRAFAFGHWFVSRH